MVEPDEVIEQIALALKALMSWNNKSLRNFDECLPEGKVELLVGHFAIGLADTPQYGDDAPSISDVITMIEFGHLSHCGLRRALNEDTYYGDAALGLWLVADGMGGHDYGEVASAIAREVIVNETRAGTSLTQAIAVAGEEIMRNSRRRGEQLPMGTTVVAARIVDNQFELAWVGDSRAYLWHQGKLAQLSHDHSYVQDLISQGTLTSEEARHHPQRKMVTQALGVTAPGQLDVAHISGQFKPGMQLLLCSDGLTEDVDDAVIAEILARPGISAQECTDTLVAAALDGGGSDNITVLVLRCH